MGSIGWMYRKFVAFETENHIKFGEATLETGWKFMDVLGRITTVKLVN